MSLRKDGKELKMTGGVSSRINKKLITVNRIVVECHLGNWKDMRDGVQIRFRENQGIFHPHI